MNSPKDERPPSSKDERPPSSKDERRPSSKDERPPSSKDERRPREERKNRNSFASRSENARRDVYKPPHRGEKRDAAASTDPNSEGFQRAQWEKLRRTINGMVNKVNDANLVEIIPELFRANIVYGRGLLCRALMKSQSMNPAFSNVYTAVVAVVNTKMPEVGELLLHRVVYQFKSSFRNNDRMNAVSSLTFLAHLVNQGVAHEIVALEVLMLLLKKPTDDSVRLAADFVQQCGMKLDQVSPKAVMSIFDVFRDILQEGKVGRRVQNVVEQVLAVRKAKFKGFPVIAEKLDIIQEDDQICHTVGLDDELEPMKALSRFSHMKTGYAEEMQQYKVIRKEILELSSDDSSGSSSSGSDSDSSDQEQFESFKGMYACVYGMLPFFHFCLRYYYSRMCACA
jgi:pre-mRNA-splicing factor CWC22